MRKQVSKRLTACEETRTAANIVARLVTPIKLSDSWAATLSSTDRQTHTV